MMQACRDKLKGLKLSDSSNSGLLLSRYLKYAADCNDQNYITARENLISSTIKTIKNTQTIYQEVFKKWEKNLNHTIKAAFETEGRTILGLGSESPIETGLRLHHIYGTPIIPGSALKGLAAHYCDQVWGKANNEYQNAEVEKGKIIKEAGNYFKILFGTTDDSGHIIFYDSWITPETLNNSLQKDIMTVHHPEYYQNDGSIDPSDFDDPTPIPFISVKGKFIIHLKCDVPGEEGEKWAKLAFDLLEEALKYWGIGGKTSSGYGRMKRNGNISVKKEESTSNKSIEQSSRKLDEFCQWFDRMKFSSSNKGNHEQIKVEIEKLNPELKKKAKEYVLTKLPKKKDRSPKLEEYLNSLN